MMSTVQAINTAVINLVEATRTQEGYEVYAQWTLRTSAPAGKIWLWIRENRDKFAVKEFAESDQDGTIELVGANLSNVYEIGISDSESEYDTSKCKPHMLLLDSYEGMNCEYDGERLAVNWKPHHAKICYGYAKVVDVNNSTSHLPLVNMQVAQFTRAMTMLAPRANYEDTVPLRVRMTPYIDEITSGPSVLSGCICTQPAKIEEVDWERTTEGAVISVRARQTYDAKTLGLSVKLALFKGTKRIILSMPTAITAAADEIFEISWKIIDAGLAAIMDQLTLALWLGQEDTWAIFLQPDNTVSLYRPVMTVDQRGKTCILEWSSEDNIEKPCFELCSNDNETVIGWRQEIPFAQVSQVDTLYSVRYAGSALGPKSMPKTPFQTGFYPNEEGTLICCAQSYKETELHLPLPGICESLPTSGISVGPLCFGEDGMLTIKTHVNLTRSDFEAFFQQLEEKGLTIRGYYHLRNVLARHAKCTEEDRLYLYCSLNSEKHSVSIIPGAILHIQAAAYSLQNGAAAEDNSGFIQGAPAEYMVNLSGGKSGAVLCMDRFFQRIKPSWEPYTLSSVPTNAVRYGGGLDLFFKTVVQPYWRIWFPYNFPLANSEPSPFASDNIILLAGAANTELETAVNRLNENPTLPVNVPHLIPNGRSFISLRHIIYINGVSMAVPIGSTLGDALAMSGGSIQSEKIEVFRNSELGMLPIYTAWLGEEARGNVLLLAGDRIEVR